MAVSAYFKFNIFTDNLVKGVYNFASDTFKMALTDVAPVASNTIFTNIVDLPAGHGYPAGGSATTITLANTAGVETVTASDVTYIGTGGSIGPFRYVVFYDATVATLPLISWFDFGGEVIVQAFSQFIIRPNQMTPTGTLFTLQ